MQVRLTVRLPCCRSCLVGKHQRIACPTLGHRGNPSSHQSLWDLMTVINNGNIESQKFTANYADTFLLIRLPQVPLGLAEDMRRGEAMHPICPSATQVTM